ncbi:hypothetical protein KR009_004477 [Drosophila setifemur]|nr:hypothetical protein KR009_004477 [Drosophila setifemur]
MRMVRPSRRKGIEELYGSKQDAIHPAKSMVVSHAGGTKATALRAEPTRVGAGPGGGLSNRQPDSRPQRSFLTEHDYFITTNLPLTAASLRNASSSMAQASTSQMVHNHSHHHHQHHQSPYTATSSRRNATKPSARQSQMSKMPHFSLAESKANNSVFSVAKPKESHRMHNQCKGNSQRATYAMDDNVDFSDKEVMASQGNMIRRPHAHAHQLQVPTQSGVLHPPQHQLHQQQQLSHQGHLKHQQQQQLQQQHHQQQIHQQQHLQQQHHQHHQHQPQQHPHPHLHPDLHPHQKHSRGRQPNPSNKLHVSAADDDVEKEDDPEEFFELIRQTVQTAVGNTISDALLKNFRDLGHKIERFSGELKQTNEHLDKLQEQVVSKVIYFGEENSRHFRYLCMKSEYDKMLFQHNQMMGGKPTPEMMNVSQANLAAAASMTRNLGGGNPSLNLKHKATKRVPKVHVKGGASGVPKRVMTVPPKVVNSGSYHPVSKAQKQQMQQVPPPSVDLHKPSSEHSLNVKSSELGMHEVLGHIQRFCSHLQMNDLGSKGTSDGLPNLEDILVTKKMSVGGLCESAAKKNTSRNQGERKVEESDLETPVDSMDEAYLEMDESQFSSELSSCSDDDDGCLKYPGGDITTRSPMKPARRAANNGAGDGQ